MAEFLSDYDFDLPAELVAQEPSPHRSDAKLLIVRRNPKWGDPRFENILVCDLPRFISEQETLKGSRWFRNRSKVFPARFYAKRSTSSRHEIVLIEASPENPNLWKAMIRNSRRFKYPETLIIEAPGTEELKVIIPSEGLVDLSPLGEDPLEKLDAFGEMPLPPYILNRNQERDRLRYQSVWAQSEKLGSAAAPTASLHFDEKTILKMNSTISFYDLVLHVGLGTFEALRHQKVSDNHLHAEAIQIPKSTAAALKEAKPPLKVAIGTTALRSMESFLLNERGDPDVKLSLDKNGDVSGRTSIFIKAGYEFLAADALLTNFHLPKSSLFILLSTFAGSLSLSQEAYQYAISQKYRFFSYGDASLWL